MKNKSMIGVYLIVLILSITILSLTIYIQNSPTPQATTDTTFLEPPTISYITGTLIDVLSIVPELEDTLRHPMKDIPILIKEDGQPNITTFYLRGDWHGVDLPIGSRVSIEYITCENKFFVIDINPYK